MIAFIRPERTRPKERLDSAVDLKDVEVMHAIPDLDPAEVRDEGFKGKRGIK